jgi:hypothetical protein
VEGPSIAFTYGPRDVAAGCVIAGRAAPGGQSWRLGFFVAVLLFFGGEFIAYDAPTLAAIPLVTAVYVALWLAHVQAWRRLVGYQAWFVRRAWGRAGHAVRRRAKVVLTDDWIRVIDHDAQVALRWRSVGAVLRGAGVIVIARQSNSPWVVVPEAAFESQGDLDEFLRVVEDRRTGSIREANEPELG